MTDVGASNTPSSIQRLSVIGAGTMGAQIAMVSALAGYPTCLVDVTEDSLQRAESQLGSRMSRDVAKGQRDAAEVKAAFDRLTMTTDRDTGTATADFVIEAAVEDVGIKRELFADLDRVCPPHTILATNSSNIVSSRMADATGRPEKVCNFHFFNPALVMECVEIVPNGRTSQDTMDTAVAMARSLGKKPVALKKETPGFVANRLLGALRTEALKLHEEGIADFADIDLAARTALRHPMGPFELMDLVGLDVVYLIRMAEYEQTGDPGSLPHPAIKELYEAGRFGRKSGRGWYNYD